MRLLHIIPQIDAGGPARGLLAFAQQTSALALPIEHRVVALSRQANGAMLAALARNGMFPLLEPAADAIDRQIRDTDSVLVHFWTAPAMIELMCRRLPAARIVLWVKIDGRHLPQRLLPEHRAFADQVILTGPSADMPGAEIVPGLGDFSRLAGIAGGRGDAVTFIGTLNRAKLHPDFFGLSDRIVRPELRFVVAGGALDAWFRARRTVTRDPARYEIPGFIEAIGPLLARSAVFGYPLAPDTYATCDKTLQEAMWAGVPPVVIAGRGPAAFVADRETGRVAATDDDYPAIVEDLLARPSERRRLGAGAAAFARTAFDPTANVARLHAVLLRAAARPKRERAPLFDVPEAGELPCPAAYRFARGFGTAGQPLIAALTQTASAAIERAVGALAALPPIAAFAEGGLFQFRNHHQRDYALRLWTGVVLAAGGDRERAEGEYAAAVAAGASPEVARAYRDASSAIPHGATRPQSETEA